MSLRHLYFVNLTDRLVATPDPNGQATAYLEAARLGLSPRQLWPTKHLRQSSGRRPIRCDCGCGRSACHAVATVGFCGGDGPGPYRVLLAPECADFAGALRAYSRRLEYEVAREGNLLAAAVGRLEVPS